MVGLCVILRDMSYRGSALYIVDSMVVFCIQDNTHVYIYISVTNPFVISTCVIYLI
jgi:hypothetical protein